MFPTIRSAVLLLLLVPFSVRAGVSCEDVRKALGSRIADVNCFASTDLTTNNPLTTPANNPLACRLNPASPVFVHFFDNDPGQPFTRWAEFMINGAQLARDGVKAGYGRSPRFTYAVGTSNGGYQVRRAVELAPELFDGGVDWEGTFVDEHASNILTDLPPAILNFPDYVASGFKDTSTAAKNIVAAGYPPDIVAEPLTMW